MRHCSNPRLIIFDYDGTIGDTSKPNASGMNVEEASKQALVLLFGTSGATPLFQVLGGLRGRSPGELMKDALAASRNKDTLFANARTAFAREHERLASCVPHGKGRPLEWTPDSPLPALTEFFVRAKLAILMDAMGKGGWPLSVQGSICFLATLRTHGIPYAILSAGHDRFIQASFSVWDCVNLLPRVMLTDDDVRGMAREDGTYPQKPDPWLMDEVLRRMGSAGVERTDVLYIGDDLARDGELAKRSGVSFGWFNPTRRVRPYSGPPCAIEFDDWWHLGPLVFAVA